MANYSKFLSLISGADRTVDLSSASAVLELGGSGLQMDGSTSGHVVISASATTSTYSIVWPAAQAVSSGYVLSNDGTGVLSWASPSSGSVTSVALALPASVFSVSGSPVTSTGTLTGSLVTQTANTVWAGPATGSAATPTFRALVSADIPDLSSIYLPLSGGTLTGALSGTSAMFSSTISASNFSGSSSGTNTGDQTITLTGDVTGSGTGSFATSIAATSNATLATLSALTTASSLASIGTITSGVWNGTAVGPIYGGTGLSSYTTGDLIYASATNTLSNLAIGSNGKVLTVVSGLPSWQTASSGSVTSVALADGSTTPIYTISGSPVTSSGTLTFTLDTQSANTVFAGPTTGSAAQPTFRSLVSADIPNLSATYVTQSEVGAASGVASLDGSGKIPVAQLPSTVMEYQGTWYPAATYAYYTGTITGTSTPVTLTAVTAGTGGNSINLTFDGSTSINTEISNWNIANPSNQVTLTSGDGSQIPTNGANAQLALGIDANTPTLSDGTGTNGYVYRVSDNYSGTLGGLSDPSMTNFQTGNFVIYSSSLGVWQQSPAADGVTSVNGMQGAVTVNAINQLTGDVTTSAASGSQSEASTVAKIQGTTVSGTTGSGNVVFSASPTLTGTITAASATLSGSLGVGTVTTTATYGGTPTLSANTTYAMRWGVPDNGETTNKLYVADWNTSSFDLFWVVGLFNSGTSTSTNASVTVTTQGTLTLGSSDTNFGSSDQGKPAWLGSSGAYVPNSTFGPSSGDANEKLGIVQSATTVWVQPQMMGVS